MTNENEWPKKETRILSYKFIKNPTNYPEVSKIGQCSFPLFKDYPYIEKTFYAKGKSFNIIFPGCKETGTGQDVGDSQITWKS